LKQGFAAFVHADVYRVLLTPQGESKGWLYIGKQMEPLLPIVDRLVPDFVRSHMFIAIDSS
jgi:hypothetical protein